MLRGLLWWLPPCLRRSVVVNLISEPDTAISGVLWQSRGSWLVLRNASLIKPELAPLPIDGEVIVHRSNVSFVQALP